MTALVNYVGPYSPAAYDAANIKANGGQGSPYSQSILDAASKIQATQPQQATAVDPNAAYKAAAATGYDTAKQGILGSTDAAIGASGNSYKSGIEDFLDTLKTQQKAIDNQGTQAELSKQQGQQGVLDYVRNGIQSGGVTLANDNAGNSSAVDALARAYSTLGARQNQSIGTQYAQAENAVGQQQDALNTNTAIQSRHNDEQKTAAVNSIVADATSKLTSLDAQIAAASLPNRINLEAEKQAIQQKATAALQQYDSLFTNGVAGITPTSQDARQAAANALATGGVTASNPYNYTTDTPAVLAQTGSDAAGASLPIYSSSTRRALT